jgi:sulfatase modifying factor 1
MGETERIREEILAVRKANQELFRRRWRYSARMSEAVGWRCVAVYMIALTACGAVQPRAVVDDARVDAVSNDADFDAQDVDASVQQFRSCVGLGATCGQNTNDSCCETIAIPGGMYYRGYDKAGNGDMLHPATISTFRLDRYEVTVGRFRSFVNAGMGTQANPPVSGAGARVTIPGSGWETSWNSLLAQNQSALIVAIHCDGSIHTWTDAPGANENLPMNCISWYDSMAFCAWDGGFLPTEAEWNYASSGGDQQRAYPWSSPADSLTLGGSLASYSDGTNCTGDGMPGCGMSDIVSVGSKSAGNGRWGQSDLAGNVAEWTLDWEMDYVNPCSDCAQLSLGTYRQARGGGFDHIAPRLRSGNRSGTMPANRGGDIGVRCAR